MRLFFDFLGGPQTLADVGVTSDEKIHAMAERVCTYGPVGFFRPLNLEDVEAIYRSAL